MARLENMPEPQRSHIANTKLPAFDTDPWVDGPLLNRRRIAIVSTAGLHRRDDRPFTFEPGDDYRIIPGDTAANELIMSHVSTNFPEDAPVTRQPDVIWTCPVNLARTKEGLSDADVLRAAFKKETVELRSWYDLALKEQQRTTVGVSGLEINQIVDFIGAFIDGVPANPRGDISLAYLLNFATDDLKAYYYEAAAAQPGSASPTADELDNWFWGDTAAAKVLLAVKERCLKNDDKMMQLLGKILIVPMSQSDA